MGHLVDRISSIARVLPACDGSVLSVVRSAGPYLFGDDGRRYVDTAMGFGSTMLGHANAPVVQACAEALRNGPLPGFSHPGEERAAAALARRLLPLQKVVFTNSGSEAVHLANRIARTVTGRGRVAKVAAGFDGWLDDVAFGNVAMPEAGFHDQHRPTNGRTTLIRFNDFSDVERLFAENDDIAAVIFEPMLANAGCLMPADGYLRHVQDVARRHGALLIADEVLMGFRLKAGLTSHFYGLDPDLATIGKAIGSGVPVAAVAGKAPAMDCFHERGGVRAGTFSGNPLACAALEATLPQLDALDYPALREKGDALRAFVERAFAAEGIQFRTSGYGNVFSFWFAPEIPGDHEAARRLADNERSLQLHLALRRNGVLVMPYPYGRAYTSLAHDEEALDLMRDAFSKAAKAIAPDVAHGKARPNL